MKEEEKFKMQKCVVCGRETPLLIEVKASDRIFFSTFGVCSKCIRDPNIEKKFFEKAVAFYEEKIKDAKSSVKYFEEELEKVKKITSKVKE